MKFEPGTVTPLPPGPAHDLERQRISPRISQSGSVRCPQRPARVQHLAAALIVLAGYALRLWHLDAWSISGDEVNSISFATRPPADLLAALATFEPHPPFYYGFLQLWLPLAGQTEFALRFPSVLFGTLGIASAYAIGRALGSRTIGLGVAAIFAINQFSILQAQDGRMYAALQALVALYVAGLIRFTRHPDRTSGLVVGLAGTLAAYTHYDGLLLVALGVIPGGWPCLRARSRRELLARLSPFIAIGGFYLPWVIYARRIFFEYSGWMAIVPPLDALRRSAITYSVGEGVGGNPGVLALMILPGFALIGLAGLALGRCWRSTALLLSLSILPFAIVIAGALLGRPLYHERYLIVVTPAYFALAGSGLACLSQRLATRLLAGIALLTLGMITLTAYYQPATPLKPDFRATVARIEAEASATAIIVMPAPQGPIVTYYLTDRLPTYTAREDDSREVVEAALTRRLAGRSEAWFVRYSDGTWDNAIGRWLESNAFYLRDRWVTQNHLVTYALAAPGTLEDRPTAARVGSQIKIARVKSGPNEVHPGDRALAGFGWMQPAAETGPIPPSIKVSLRLIDPWGQAVAMLDRNLINPARLSDRDADSNAPRVWQGALPVPEDAVPGRYRREAVFYDQLSGQVWPVFDASGSERSALDLGDVTVAPAPAIALGSGVPLDPSAISVSPSLYAQRIRLSMGPYTPATRLTASFAWAAQEDQKARIIPELAVRSASGQIVASTRRPEDAQPYRLGQLRAGERVRERIEVSLRSITEPGIYTVLLRTNPDESWKPIGAIDVAVDPRRYQKPASARSRSDLFDGTIRLVGVTLPSGAVPAGSSFLVSLAWSAEQLPAAQYTVFIHLIDDSGRLLAQSDSPPDGGHRPTLDWVLGEYVLDTHQIDVPPTLAAGEYRLVAGLYQADTGQRARVTAPTASDNRIELGPVTISAH